MIDRCSAGELRMAQRDRIWAEGFHAYEAGKPNRSPYGGMARHDWLDGWEQARHEYEDSPPNE